MDKKTQQAFEARSHALFERSVENLDLRMRSRLTQARFAALEAGAPRSRFVRRAWWMPAGFAAAALLGMSLWMGTPAQHHGVSSGDAQQTTYEDMDIVAAADDGSGDAMDMLQDDLDFYEYADKAAGADSV